MSKFFAYLKDEQGSAVEYAALAAGLVVLTIAATTNTAVKTAAGNMLATGFNLASGKMTF